MNQTISNSPLVLENLTKLYGDKCALDAVSLNLPKSGITALLGANGAGKTTLINCALGLCNANSGHIRTLGGKPGTHKTKQQIGVMLQDADLPDLLTAREHITLFSAYYSDPLPVTEVIKQCDLIEFADKRYKQLSGGQKRRVQFALAILGRPKLVFLDEPTTGLDIEARRVLWNTIRELENAGTAVVLTTHYLEEADALADHIVVIHQGSVIADAPTAEIRAAVSGAIIHCETNVDHDSAAGFEGVTSVRKSGRYLEILTTSGTSTLTALLTADPRVKDLTVKKPSLEEAFNQLTESKSINDLKPLKHQPELNGVTE